MGIIYTNHAKERAIKRFIRKEWIEQIIKNPDELIDVRYERKQAIKMINNKEISVIYVKEDSNFVVITAFWGR